MHDSHMMVNLHVNALSIQLYYIVDLVVITFVLAFYNVTSNLQNSVHDLPPVAHAWIFSPALAVQLLLYCSIKNVGRV